MNRQVELMRRLLLSAGVLILTSCAQLPKNISAANKTTVTGSIAKFEQCAMSVRFTGPSRAFTPTQLVEFTAQFAKEVGKFAKWEVDVLVYDEYRLGEWAFCMCRDYEFSGNEISNFEKFSRSNRKYKFTRAFDPPHSRRAIEVEGPDGEFGVGIKSRLLFMFPTKAPNCMFMQLVAFDTSTSSTAAAFIDTAQVAVEPSSGSAVSPPAPAQSRVSTSDRLEELRDLHRRGLITQQEYQQKRKAVLDGL
jgi:Short C-terminal domain